MPIRKLPPEMGEAFARLAPRMLMSPLSIAQYLPPDQALFDLVIFDEASQIAPWDAIGAMARGRQVIIAGDPRQMPPGNDFARGMGAGTADDDTEADMERILDECLAAGVPQHSLDCHYRSRHESLITFSNTRHYDSNLVTFPPPSRVRVRCHGAGLAASMRAAPAAPTQSRPGDRQRGGHAAARSGLRQRDGRAAVAWHHHDECRADQAC
jgi:superfamily I DNA and/or RNA helicase